MGLHIIKYMKHTDSVSLKIEGKDFMDLGDKFVIFNVPLAAELVQQYADGYAYKPKDEIQNIDVQNVPLTINALSPSHPPRHLSSMTTDERAKYIIGMMSEPSRPKSDADPRKRYADYILFKSDVTQHVIDGYKAGDIIDTSIGFKYKAEPTTGTFDGAKYDYVQRNITLDHNTILMDVFGRKGRGRMPSPIGGIGADSAHKKNNTGDYMTEQIDKLTKELAKVTEERDGLLELKKAADEAIIKEATDELQKANDELTAKVESLKQEKDEAVKQNKEAMDALKKYQDAEKEQLDAMRKDLIEKNEDLKQLYDEASDDTIRVYHKKLLESQGKDSHSIAADMMGNQNNAKKVNELARTEQWIKKDE